MKILKPKNVKMTFFEALKLPKSEYSLATQILREIKFGEFKSCKTVILCHFRGSEFQPSKSAQNFLKIKIHSV